MSVIMPIKSGQESKITLLTACDAEGPNPPYTKTRRVESQRAAVCVATVAVILLVSLVPIATYAMFRVVSLSGRVEQLEQLVGSTVNVPAGFHGHLDQPEVDDHYGDDDYDDGRLEDFGDYEGTPGDDEIDVGDNEQDQTGYVWKDIVQRYRSKRGTDRNKQDKTVTCAIRTNSKNKKIAFVGSKKDNKICYAAMNKYITARLDKKAPMTAIHLQGSIPVDANTARWLDEDQNRFKDYPEQDGRLNSLGFLPNGQTMAFWKQADWSDNGKTCKMYKFNKSDGSVQVLKTGLYFIYAQVQFHETQAYLGYHMQRGGSEDARLFSCHTNVNPLPPQGGEPEDISAADIALRQSCTLSGTVHLVKDDILSLEQSGRIRSTVIATGDSTYWGVIHLSAQ